MRRSLYRRGPGLRSTVIVAGVVAFLSLSPTVWAAGQAPAPEQVGGPQVLRWLGDWVGRVFSDMESLWEAAGCRIDPDGTPCASSTTTADTQDGETCDPTTTEAGCRIDPDG